MDIPTASAKMFRPILISSLALATLLGPLSGAVMAQQNYGEMREREMRDRDRQERHSQAYAEHRGWASDRGQDYHYRRGQRMGYNDWNSAPVVDYHERHLRRPRAGYEWREHNGRYVMVAIATGLIASVLINQR